MKFFDARCMLGNRAAPQPGEPATKEEILAQMARFGIEKAIVYHAMAREADTPTGNRLLLDEIGEDKRFLPQWCVIPSAFGEVMDVQETFAAMKANSVSTMRLQPVINGFSLRPYTLGRLMDAAADCHMPVFLNLHEELQPKQVYDLCQDYPHVRFVICNSGSGERRMLSPILDTCPNLYLGTGMFPDTQWLRQLCRRWGANRFLFDTGLPAGSPERAVTLIHDAPISTEEKAQIAWGNLENLLSEVTL